MKNFPIAQQKSNEAFFSCCYLLLFDIFLLAILILATRLATFLHELMGHALMVMSFGGHVNGIRVSLFGGGHVYYNLLAESDLIAHFLVAFSGIFVNILSGLLSFTLIHRIEKQSRWTLFFVLFGMVSLLGATAYSALGFYYQEGDPVAWLKEPSPYIGWLCIPFLIVSPFVSYFTIKSFSTLIERWFPSKTFLNRISIVFLTLGITGCAYAGLYGLSGQRSTAIDAPSSAFNRAEKEVRKEKMEDLFRRLRKSYPELSDAEVRQMVNRTPIVIRPDEVPKKFPIKPVIAILYAAGALLALRSVKGDMSFSLVRISPRSMVLTVTLAGAVLGVLAFTGGWIYRT